MRAAERAGWARAPFMGREQLGWSAGSRGGRACRSGAECPGLAKQEEDRDEGEHDRHVRVIYGHLDGLQMVFWKILLGIAASLVVSGVWGRENAGLGKVSTLAFTEN